MMAASFLPGCRSTPQDAALKDRQKGTVAGGKVMMDEFAYSADLTHGRLRAMNDAAKNLEITDADFFGEWRDGHWVKAPMLDYDYQEPALSVVEAAAKAGDYEQAAVALLAYYQSKEFPEAKKVLEMPEDLTAEDSFYAANKITQITNVVKSGWFKREACTPRECVETLKTVVRRGMQFSTGHSDNTSMNGIGGNFIPWSLNEMFDLAEFFPELADTQRRAEQSCIYMMKTIRTSFTMRMAPTLSILSVIPSISGEATPEDGQALVEDLAVKN
jgi:hypothetical protein